MSTETVAARMGAPQEYALAIEQACIRYRIASTLQKAHFIAQMKVESNDFTAVEENLNYSVEALLANFGRHRISEADARKYGRAPGRPADRQMIANLIYGGEFGRTRLGNIQFGDGWRFRGRGLKQLTGRDNYTRFSVQTYGDLRCVQNPDLLLVVPACADSGAWYWTTMKIGPYAERHDTLGVSRLVNLGQANSGTPNGWARRQSATAEAIRLFEEITQ